MSLLLIEPYGIETLLLDMICPNKKNLLIEPYGIETTRHTSSRYLLYTFNRTLWN